MKNLFTKKTTVLLLLFIGPLLFYIFLSLGIYQYANLPILTSKVENIKGTETFKGHFSVVSFLGTNPSNSKSGLFNLNEVIYKRFKSSKYFQAVLIIPQGADAEVEALKKKLKTYTDISKWKFVSMTNEDIQKVFSSFDSPYQLNEQMSSDYVFIIDRELRLRGRNDDEDTEGGKLYGYNMTKVADLKNKMKKDLEIIYYQLKKSIEKEQRFQRKK